MTWNTARGWNRRSDEKIHSLTIVRIQTRIFSFQILVEECKIVAIITCHICAFSLVFKLSENHKEYMNSLILYIIKNGQSYLLNWRNSSLINKDCLLSVAYSWHNLYLSLRSGGGAFPLSFQQAFATIFFLKKIVNSCQFLCFASKRCPCINCSWPFYLHIFVLFSEMLLTLHYFQYLLIRNVCHSVFIPEPVSSTWFHLSEETCGRINCLLVLQGKYWQPSGVCVYEGEWCLMYNMCCTNQ